jgi:hypothetical protein
MVGFSLEGARSPRLGAALSRMMPWNGARGNGDQPHQLLAQGLQ